MYPIYDAIIIGAGPAGMMAAIRAAGRGRKVFLLEKMPSAGRKLLLSGKSRCNLTNAGGIDKFLKKFSPSGNFLRNAFARFFNDELCRFFEESGCKLKTERGERIFPASDRAEDVLNVLLSRLKGAGVEIKYGEEAVDILPGDFFCCQTRRGNGQGEYFAQKIAICTGGLSYPVTGSTGFGFKVASKTGHTVIPPRPGLVAVVAKSEMPALLAGLSLENIKCSVICGNKIIDSRFGDMLFTHFGLSGPVMLDLSGAIYDLIERGGKAFVSISLKPAIDEKKLNARLQREFQSEPNKMLKSVFEKLLPKRFVMEFLNYCRIDAAKRANQITKPERKKLINCLFDFRLQITGTKSIRHAIITRGGVSTKQINPKTMESKIVKGLYFAGEVIDVDAKTGGYNMQAAFSTGYVCGENL